MKKWTLVWLLSSLLGFLGVLAFLLGIICCGGTARADSPIIWGPSGSKDLSSGGLTTSNLHTTFDVTAAGNISTTGGGTSITSAGTISAAGTISTNGTVQAGTVSLLNGSYRINLLAPTLAATSTLTLPAGTGTVGQYMATDGTGVLSWTSPTSNVFNTQALTSVVAMGTAGFEPLGHTIDTKDFATTKAAFWNNFSASNLSDGSGYNQCSSGTAACTLTNTASAVTFGNAGAFGGTTSASFNGTSAELVCSDAFCKPGSNAAAYYAWINPTSWNPASPQVVFGQYDASGNRAVEFYLGGSGGNPNTLILNVYVASQATACQIFVPTTGFSGWHHIAAVVDSPNLKCYVYVDGKLGQSQAMSGAMYASTTSLKIGSEGATSSAWYSGKMEQIGIVNGYSMTADDIRKLAARRFDHNSGISPDAQVWTATWERSDQLIPVTLDNSWIVSKDKNSLYADFSGVAAGAFVGFKGQSLSVSPTNVSQYSYDSTWLSTTPPTTIAHGMGSIPDNAKVQYTTGYGATGAVQTYDAGQYCSADATNFYCDWTGLTVNATNTVRLTAWMNGAQTAVTAASASNSGIVNTTAQTFAGVKTFANGITGVTDGDVIHVYNSADITTTSTGGSSAIWSPVTFDTKPLDTNTAFASNVYTCKKAGLYLVTVSGSLTVGAAGQSSGYLWMIELLKNNSAYGDALSLAHPTTGTYMPYATSWVVSMNVGDTLKEQIQENSGAFASSTVTNRGASMSIAYLRQQ